MIQRKLCFETVVQITSNTRFLPFFFFLFFFFLLLLFCLFLAKILLVTFWYNLSCERRFLIPSNLHMHFAVSVISNP